MVIVIPIDKHNKKVYIDCNISNSYSPLTPTYVKQTLSIFKDYHLGEPFKHTIGESKI